jgi:hypothetical protein
LAAAHFCGSLIRSSSAVATKIGADARKFFDSLTRRRAQQPCAPQKADHAIAN